MQIKLCLISHFHTVNGGWSYNHSFNECIARCAGENVTMTKHCNNPNPQHGGKDCKCDENDPDEVFCDGKFALVDPVCNVCHCPGECPGPGKSMSFFPGMWKYNILSWKI